MGAAEKDVEVGIEEEKPLALQCTSCTTLSMSLDLFGPYFLGRSFILSISCIAQCSPDQVLAYSKIISGMLFCLSQSSAYYISEFEVSSFLPFATLPNV